MALGCILFLGLIDALLYVLLGSQDPLHLSVAIPGGTVIYMATCLYGPFLLGDYLEAREINLRIHASWVVPVLGGCAAALLVPGIGVLGKATSLPMVALGAMFIWLGIASLSFAMRCVRST